MPVTAGIAFIGLDRLVDPIGYTTKMDLDTPGHVRAGFSQRVTSLLECPKRAGLRSRIVV